jgi:hypothetical protein
MTFLLLLDYYSYDLIWYIQTKKKEVAAVPAPKTVTSIQASGTVENASTPLNASRKYWYLATPKKDDE